MVKHSVDTEFGNRYNRNKIKKILQKNQKNEGDEMALRRERMRLGDILIKQNVLTEEQLKQALELQKGSGKKIGEVLVDSGMITEEMIVRALQMQLGLKVVHLSGLLSRRRSRNLVSVSLLKKYQCIPFELDPYNANILHLAMLIQWI